jgi:hypothetical protein
LLVLVFGRAHFAAAEIGEAEIEPGLVGTVMRMVPAMPTRL